MPNPHPDPLLVLQAHGQDLRIEYLVSRRWALIHQHHVVATFESYHAAAAVASFLGTAAPACPTCGTVLPLGVDVQALAGPGAARLDVEWYCACGRFWGLRGQLTASAAPAPSGGAR